jgi:hypothetical protein
VGHWVVPVSLQRTAGQKGGKNTEINELWLRQLELGPMKATKTFEEYAATKTQLKNSLVRIW